MILLSFTCGDGGVVSVFVLSEGLVSSPCAMTMLFYFSTCGDGGVVSVFLVPSIYEFLVSPACPVMATYCLRME